MERDGGASVGRRPVSRSGLVPCVMYHEKKKKQDGETQSRVLLETAAILHPPRPERTTYFESDADAIVEPEDDVDDVAADGFFLTVTKDADFGWLTGAVGCGCCGWCCCRGRGFSADGLLFSSLLFLSSG